MSLYEFDLVVIGTGSAGSAAAQKCAASGWKVAQIDSEPFGGTCALRGCDPKRVLSGASEIVDWHHRMAGSGIRGDTRISWPELMQFKRSFTDPVPDSRVESMKKAGIVPFRGRATFVDKHSVRTGEDTLHAKHILIAAGARPAPVSIDGFEHLTTSTQFMELDEMPATVVFVGGGYISFEFAHIAARTGADIHIVHRGKRPLNRFDADVVAILVEKSRSLGITLHLESVVESVERSADVFTVHTSQNGTSNSISGGLVVHGAGRVPDLHDMGLEIANVKTEKNGVVVNEYLQSVTSPHVYAAGDAVASEGKPLTPVAGMESHIVAENLLEGNHRKAEYPAQPTAVFTVPPLAAVGLTEKQAAERGLDVTVKLGRTDEWYVSSRTNESFAGYKTLVDPETDTIVGAHFLGEFAPELVNMVTVAINKGITASELKQMMFAYPTNSSYLQYMM